MDGWKDGWMDGWMDGVTGVVSLSRYGPSHHHSPSPSFASGKLWLEVGSARPSSGTHHGTWCLVLGIRSGQMGHLAFNRSFGRPGQTTFKAALVFRPSQTVQRKIGPSTKTGAMAYPLIALLLIRTIGQANSSQQGPQSKEF